MNWLETVLYGFFVGLTEILPVSAQAHRMLLLTVFGEDSEPELLRLLVHIAVLAALYYGCLNHILRITRALKLARIPKRKRKRPLDTASLMDFKLLRTMLIPMFIGFVFHSKLSGLVSILSVLSFTMFVNGVILFVPQYLPGSNKESLSMTPLDGMLMGAASILSQITGISAIGTVTAVGSVRGGDRSYILSMALLLNMCMTVGYIVLDILAILSVGIGALSLEIVAKYLVCAIAAFAGVLLAILLLRRLAQRSAYGLFSYYCWGMALFIFILFLSI